MGRVQTKSFVGYSKCYMLIRGLDTIEGAGAVIMEAN